LSSADQCPDEKRNTDTGDDDREQASIRGDDGKRRDHRATRDPAATRHASRP
jgi:hypothetical protein